MNKENIKKPDFLFETSWEVCNLVGGIYTVLSTRAKVLSKELNDNLIFIGPDVWKELQSPYFKEDKELFTDWKNSFQKETNLKVKVGRWTIPGKPISILVDFSPLYEKKDEVYADFWNKYQVDSLHAYGDYDEASMFGYASGMIIESFYRFNNLENKNNVLAHFNEWMTSFGAFYVNDKLPAIATLFTTHATSIGRSIAGNNKPLYDYLSNYNGDQMAQELNMIAKHSTEKTAAHLVDCFTTVSHVTAKECKELLDIEPHVATPNGFESDFVAKGTEFNTKRDRARKRLFEVSEALLGYKLSEKTQFIVTAGRYEFKNKGLDIFIEAMSELNQSKELKDEVVAFIMVPAYIIEARKSLKDKLNGSPETQIEQWNRYTTHELHDFFHDNIIATLRWFNVENLESDKVKVIFVPSYLNGNDGIFNLSYWNLLIGMDMSVFPSYYEPWGYTPLESVAFSVPTITTNLSGFGQWVMDNFSENLGASVINRSDYNYSEVVKSISSTLQAILQQNKTERNKTRSKAKAIAKKASWDNFIQYYHEAYDIAISNRDKRINRK